MPKIIFKPLTSQQIVLFPENIGDRIPENHLVRLISQVVDNLKLDEVFSEYKGGGTSSYHPRMMLKALFYAYFNNIYSCRKIEKALNENIYFMWLSGNSTPDFRTINRFRGKQLKAHIQKLFTEIVLMLNDLGYVTLETVYADGTKIEAASNKYTFVWKGSVEKNKAVFGLAAIAHNFRKLAANYLNTKIRGVNPAFNKLKPFFASVFLFFNTWLSSISKKRYCYFSHNQY